VLVFSFQLRIECSGYVGLHSSEFLDQMNNNQFFNSCFVLNSINDWFVQNLLQIHAQGINALSYETREVGRNHKTTTRQKYIIAVILGLSKL
jgi:hypothetical protein